MIGQLKNIFRKNSELFPAGFCADGDWDLFLLTSSNKGMNAKTILFATTKEVNAPIFCIKVLHNDSGYGCLDSIYKNISLLDNIFKSCAASFIYPKVIFLGKISCHWVLIETFQSGASLKSILLNGDGNAHCLRFLDIIYEFNKQSRSIFGQRTGTPESRFIFSTQEDIGDGAATYLRCLERDFAGNSNGLKPVFCHGDLNVGNIIYQGGRFSILDWEFSRPYGVAMVDILHFLVTSNMFKKRLNFYDSFLDLFSTGFFVNNSDMKELLRKYLDFFGIDQKMCEVLLVQYILHFLSFSHMGKPELIRLLNLFASDKINTRMLFFYN